jgi:Tol biopolymer transport system component
MSLRSCRVLVVAAAVGLAVGVPPAFGAAGVSGEYGRIAFISDRDGDYDIWSMRPNGSNPINLTADSTAFEFGPSWRSDGRKIAFMSNRVTPTNPGPNPDYEIFVMHPDGSRVRQLTANTLDDEFPSWSPDGRKLVFHRDFNPIPGPVDWDLFTMRADGTGQRNLTRSPGIDEHDADWAPNGRRIAFERGRDKAAEIYTMRPDGSRVRQLTVNGSADRNPAWSPDSRKLAFDTDRDGGFDIYKMRADGSDQTRLTFNNIYQTGAAWSPDGTRIAFHRERNDNLEVYTMRADGSDQVNLTRHPATDWFPEWQPQRQRHH